jgi:amino acid transporter
MLGIAIAFIAIGLVLGFFLPFGWIVGAIGVILVVGWYRGLSRPERQRSDRV